MVTQEGLSGNFVAGEAFTSSDQYVAVNIDSAGTSDTSIEVEKCDADEVAVGIYQGGTASAGDAVSVVYAGVSKARAGAAVSVNDQLKTDSDGKLVPTTTDTDQVVAQALTAADNADEIIKVIVVHAMYAG